MPNGLPLSYQWIVCLSETFKSPSRLRGTGGHNQDV